MKIREATHHDIPQILKVLKASLGEISSKKTEEVWRYKHIDNPFGESLVLVAEEEGEIAGVRAFMRWKWQKGNEIYSAFRAVDTATHPKHQGKGIFKKLTLKALELGKERGDHFVFNTPNSQSLPGYLKMGWQKVGKIQVQLIPTGFIHWKFKHDSFVYSTEDRADAKELKTFMEKIQNKYIEDGRLFTPKTAEFLSWRYENNPMQRYEVYKDSQVYMAGYKKKHKYFYELRIVECLSASPTGLRMMQLQLKAWIKKFGVQFVSFGKERCGNRNLKLSGNFGPVLTIRDIELRDKPFSYLLDLDKWNYSLGDLELF
ncbi:GNAT family N-acetyltransferase [Salinimicrobium oceani]|uniref:GNAT family N-acetyltransferase n=1 Tax=Salinimicrobium oceani TaxID=2722702 RepID=A0ABX1CYU0_9FLAO|nr:GNAT family N-acetyltransferase [Salinimicrobium oceani]NJW53434.1 GNAT family N-acetyltransferase [Salinimicrobium oceani]